MEKAEIEGGCIVFPVIVVVVVVWLGRGGERVVLGVTSSGVVGIADGVVGVVSPARAPTPLASPPVKDFCATDEIAETKMGSRFLDPRGDAKREAGI